MERLVTVGIVAVQFELALCIASLPVAGGDWLRSQLLVNIAVLQAPREEETSRRQLARALAICPDNVDAAYNLSLLLLAAGKTEAARRIWQQHGFRPEDADSRSSSSVGAPQATWLEARLSQWHVRLFSNCSECSVYIIPRLSRRVTEWLVCFW